MIRLKKCSYCGEDVPEDLIGENGEVCTDLCELCLIRLQNNYWHRVKGELQEPGWLNWNDEMRWQDENGKVTNRVKRIKKGKAIIIG